MIASILILSGWQIVSAQNSKKQDKAAKIKAMVEAQNYVFEANYVSPMRGTAKSLTYGYDLVVSKDTVKAYLPYFGRVTIAPADPSDGGVKFTSTHFDYKSTLNKKGSYEIVITPKENNMQGSKDVRYLRLTIGSSGYATLQVTSNNRDPISYNGTIEARNPKKEN